MILECIDIQGSQNICIFEFVPWDETTVCDNPLVGSIHKKYAIDIISFASHLKLLAKEMG